MFNDTVHCRMCNLYGCSRLQKHKWLLANDSSHQCSDIFFTLIFYTTPRSLTRICVYRAKPIFHHTLLPGLNEATLNVFASDAGRGGSAVVADAGGCETRRTAPPGYILLAHECTLPSLSCFFGVFAYRRD